MDATIFQKEPNDYRCPLCDHGKEEFKERSIELEVHLASDEYQRNKK